MYNEVLIPFFAQELGKFRQHWKDSDTVWPHGIQPTSQEFFMEIHHELESVISTLKRIEVLLSENEPRLRGRMGQDFALKGFIKKLESEEVRLG